MGQSVCRALTADFTATRNIQGARTRTEAQMSLRPSSIESQPAPFRSPVLVPLLLPLGAPRPVQYLVTVRGRVGQRADGLERLDGRARPAMHHDQRQCVLMLGAHVDEVGVDVLWDVAAAFLEVVGRGAT
jgi:hypothetical protein